MLTVNFSEIDKSHTLDRDALIKGAKIKNNAEWKQAEGSSLSPELLAQIRAGAVFIKTSPTKTKMFATDSDKNLCSRCLGGIKADAQVLQSILSAK